MESFLKVNKLLILIYKGGFLVGFRVRLYVNIESVYIYKVWKGNFKKNY